MLAKLLPLLAQAPGAIVIAGHEESDGMDLGVHGVVEAPEGVRAAVLAGAR